jgi:hypothetical protein
MSKLSFERTAEAGMDSIQREPPVSPRVAMPVGSSPRYGLRRLIAFLAKRREPDNGLPSLAGEDRPSQESGLPKQH